MTVNAPKTLGMGDGADCCGARAWRTFTIEGFITVETYTTVQVVCTRVKGHPTRHGGWLWLQTDIGPQVQAKVEW